MDAEAEQVPRRRSFPLQVHYSLQYVDKDEDHTEPFRLEPNEHVKCICVNCQNIFEFPHINISYKHPGDVDAFNCDKKLTHLNSVLFFGNFGKIGCMMQGYNH